MRAVVLAFALMLLPVLSAPAAAQLYSCRTYPTPAVVAQIKTAVEAMRLIEREAADRLIGLDTRPYDWLRDQARAAEAALAVPDLLEAEGELKRCRNFIRPVRGHCAAGAAALVRVIEDLVAGQATNEAKMAYGQTMPHCEGIMQLQPLSTVLRGTK